MTYAAFLLGINVGPHKRVAMPALKKMCENMGYQNVSTLLASGNVVFDAPKKSEKAITIDMEKELQNTFGFEVEVIVWTVDDLRALVELNPFKKEKSAKDVQWYVTFCSEKPKLKKGKIFSGSEGEYSIVYVNDALVCGVVDLKKGKTTDYMTAFKKECGARITTRNWNTIQKMIH